MLTAPGAVVTVARGLRIAQRGAGASGLSCDLSVVDVAPIALPDAPAAETRTLHGDLVRRVWSLSDRLVIEFVDVCAVEVRDHDKSVVFDRALTPDTEQHVLLDHVLPLVLARRQELVLHGAVLLRGERAAVLVGPSGAGKSTLTAYAGRHGWTVGGDDGAVLGLGTPLTVEPTYPTVRLTPHAVGLLGIGPTESSEIAGKRRLYQAGGRPFRQEPASLGLVVGLGSVPADGEASFTRLRGAAAHAALFATTFHAELGEGGLLRNVVEGLARVVDEVLVGQLSVPRGEKGLAAAERVLRRQLRRSEAAP